MNRILPKLNDICNAIISSENNKVEQSKYIDTFVDYLLGKDWSNLEDVLLFSTEETLELIAQVLSLPEVKKNLPIIRNKFLILKVRECSIPKYVMYLIIGSMIEGNECLFYLGENEKESNVIYVIEYLKNQKKGTKFYNKDVLQEISSYRERIIKYFAKKNNNAMKIINCLIHDNLESYVDDIVFEYKINVINDLFNDNFYRFKTIIMNSNKDEAINIEYMRQLLTPNQLQEYIIDHYNSKDEITKCITELDKMKNSNILNNNNRDIFDIVYQAFKDRQALLDKNEKPVNNINNNNEDNK